MMIKSAYFSSMLRTLAAWMTWQVDELLSYERHMVYQRITTAKLFSVKWLYILFIYLFIYLCVCA